jgi:hypothetical protein
MSARLPLESQSPPMANYSSAIAKALEWLGDRYLLAKPINSALSSEAQAQARLTAPRRARPSSDVGNG